MSDHHMYAVTVGCPNCEEVTQFVEVRDGPVPIDMDISVNATHCPHCGIHQASVGPGWDHRAEHKITTTGTDEGADEMSNRESNKVATSECLVPGCPFVAIEENPEQNPIAAAEKVADHINEVHDTDEIPEDYDRADSGGEPDGRDA